ncbi:hypothetical protein HMPREF1437_00905 [Helicobacter pylori HP116Bi]|nr:hypothetical protein HMPREF1437_00905 [Helicobacter pylori HP116Bi]
MDSSVFLDALDIGYSFIVKCFILADVGSGLICSLCSGFIKNIMDTNSYLVKATQDILISILKPTTFTTQSETESIFLTC